ncbi:MAG: hypothetical protein WCG73_03620 [Candidatus Moraniibacteriota bacterium]
MMIRVDCQPAVADAVESAMKEAGAQYIDRLTKDSTGQKVFLALGGPMVMLAAMGAGASASSPLS